MASFAKDISSMDTAFSHIHNARIVLVEDEVAIQRLVKKTLEELGALVNEVCTLKLARPQCALWRPDLILLDLGLPDGDGNDLITEVRTYSRVPIIVLSARVNESDKVRALLAGADDYLTKPFSANELLARVEVSLRRNQQTGLGETSEAKVSLGCCEIDLSAHTLTNRGAAEHLTKVEWRLLTTLLAHKGKVLTHHKLLTEVWGPTAATHTHYLRIYIQRLRNKIEPNPVQPRYILTEIGIGYRLVDDHERFLFDKSE